MKAVLPTIEVVGSTVDDVEGCTKFVDDGSILTLSTISIRCILTSGHTMGHMSYYATQGDHKVVFTGDCLFVGGVGKFFEGTAADMHLSLFEKLGKLPAETLVYCGHEYTLSNYRFALSVDGNNEHLISANIKAATTRSEGRPTIPSTIQTELDTNPFFRVNETSLRESCGRGSSDPIQILHNVREMKNNFK